ncbi:MAG: toprim domain-containing protein, partial [Holosporaceae bacterium]|nr:toprim domain-containing protein [Holosporaceae bacterium]
MKKIDPIYIWSRSVKSDDHEYLRRKHIGSCNAKVNVYCGRKQLVIPLIDSIPHNGLKGLQLIQEDGSKSFPLPFKGLFHVASGGQCNPIVIAEGYATAVSIYEATGLFTIAARSACNMKTVALKVRELFPYSDIIIAADNDDAGRRAAKEKAIKKARAEAGNDAVRKAQAYLRLFGDDAWLKLFPRGKQEAYQKGVDEFDKNLHHQEMIEECDARAQERLA